MRRFGVFNINNKTEVIKLYFQRAALYFFTFVLIFTLFQPADVLAINNSSSNSEPSQVAPLETSQPQGSYSIIDDETAKLDAPKKIDSTPVKEDVSQRTLNSSVFINQDGTRTLQYSTTQKNYEENGKWEKIDNTIEPEKTDPPKRTFWEIITFQQKEAPKPKKFSGEAGVIDAEMLPFAEGTKLIVEGKTIHIKPQNANNVWPEKKDDRTVIYRNAWNGVDVEYELRGETIKEVIVVKNTNAPSDFNFTVDGGKIINHPTRPGELALDSIDPEKYSFSALTVDVNGQGVVSDTRATQTPTNNGMKISLDKEWLKSLPVDSFPLRVDPSFYRFNSNGGVIFKSDGYSCNPGNCYYNTGTINNGGWKHWRTYFNFNYDQLRGNKKVLHARLQMPMARGINGDESYRKLHLAWANCLSGFHCIGNSPRSVGGGSLVADIDFTETLKWLINLNGYDGWFAVWGEEGPYKSYKPFYEMHIDVVYDTPTPVAPAKLPEDKQVIVDTQPTLKVNSVADGDGEAVQYRFRVSSNRDGGGAIVSSGWQNDTQWTVPEGVLQDGSTYYWRVDTKGASNTGTETLGDWVRSFKIDLRKGKNNSQTYDTVGPMSINLATGNATTEENTHTMSALGGDIGVALHYNTTASSEKGLLGEYWNISRQDFTYDKLPSGKPLLQRTEKNINFDWSNGGPGGSVAPDWFFSQWQGYFIPPKTGEYTFGKVNDDAMQVRINDQPVVSGGICKHICYGSGVHLEAGKPVKIEVRHIEATSPAYAKLYVKGVVQEQIIPHEWLRTPVIPKQDQYGLKGHYYRFDDKPNFPADGKDPNYLLMVRNDTKLAFDWKLDGPAPGMTKDKFMVRWTGYITTPKTGKYQLGIKGDDGARIKLGTGLSGSQEIVLDNWRDQIAQEVAWGKEVTLSAGKQVPIVVEYYDNMNAASIGLYIRGEGITPQEVSEKWLTPQADTLPDGWKLGLDVDGNIAYDRLRVAGNNIILEDASGTTHEYTWTGGGFKPPNNEDGHLMRNADNTYTLLDSDGRQYIFGSDGQLKEMTTPEDDRKPAALRYEYSGDPSRLVKIIDSVNTNRYGELFYKDINDHNNICTTEQGFDTIPSGYLCAFKTSDGDTTKFHYKYGRLARIEKPGKEFDDYGYDELGRLITVRDAAANDTVAHKIRDNDASITTELTYDEISRIKGIKAPSATAQSARNHHTFTYEAMGIDGVSGATRLHIEGASEPHGFSKRIEYDKLFRTVKETDLTGNTITTQWHENRDLQLSKTDAKGLKSTTIYNDDDMPIEQFGPAPKEWFGVDNRPLAAHVASTPRTETRYDEEVKGPAVAWYGLKSGNMTLYGAPLYHSTGFASNNPPENGRQDYMRHDFTKQPLPFTVDTKKYDGYGFIATGKIRLPQTGTYTFNISTDDSVKLLVDDREVVGNWGTKTQSTHRNSLKGTFQAEAGKLYRFEYRYGHEGMSDLGSMSIGITGPGLSGDPLDWSRVITPGYNLQTTQKAYDAQAGNIETKTIYKNPAYGQIEKTVLDPGGLNYESKAEYEAPGAGYLRQTSKTLPGGAKTTYLHYSGSDMRDNPCTPENDPAPQAGRPKGKVEPDPDGDGPQQGRSSETIYNHAGDIVATRYNNDSWTCTEYDTRGRVVKTIVPDRNENGQAIKGRTITNNYALNGNPLITTTTDESGTITVENDLLGRTIKYTDTKGHVTTNIYDNFGKLTQRTSPIGTETYEYDQFDRLVKHKLDNVTFATVTYNEFSDIQKVDYPAGISLSSITRDALGRENGNTYTLASGQTLSDQIERYVSGDIKQGVELGVQKSYTYDNTGRLTSARLGDNTFSYEFGTPHESCAAVPGYNPNTAKSGNRTKLTMNGEAITFCYDQADRLISASDPSLTNAKYDSHGNTIRLGDDAHTTHFTYDASDRNTAIRSGDKQTHYTRDAQDRILSRTHTQPNAPDSTTHYGFTGSGDTPDFTTDAAGNITQKHLTLPGDVLVTIKSNIQSAGATTFSLPNLHGDIFATINADGSLTSTFMTGPFGEHLPNQITQPPNTLAPTQTPINTTPGTTYNYVGQHQKMTDLESSAIIGGITQMGARVYLPILGRFLQVDPVEGGTDNNYVYANDPVNEFDLDGKWIRDAWDNTKKAARSAAKWVWRHREEISAVAGTTACIIGTAGVCTGVAIAAATVSGVAAGYNKYRQTRSFRKAVWSGLRSGATDFTIGWVAGKIAGAKHTARYFGKIRKTGTVRYYRSFTKAWRKIPVRKRAYRQVWAGAMSYGYQKWRR